MPEKYQLITVFIAVISNLIVMCKQEKRLSDLPNTQ